MAVATLKLKLPSGKIYTLRETAANEADATAQMQARSGFSFGTYVPDTFKVSKEVEDAPTPVNTGTYGDYTLECRDANQEPVTLNLENMVNTVANGVNGEMIVPPTNASLIDYLAQRGLTLREGRERR